MVQANYILERIAGVADELKLDNLRPQITACRERFNEDGRVDIAVLGHFKAGKSSLLNHLIGKPVLPVGAVPVTAVVTRLRYGVFERAEVQFLGGWTREIAVGEIGLYVCQNKNPDNEKQVAAVVIELPQLKPFAPLQFVDTPGIGSTFAHNTEVALNWLPNVNAALVAISSDAPLSEGDLALLNELRRYTPKIVLLLTKADLLTNSQRLEVIGFVKQQISRHWDSELPVFYYSIEPALSSLKLRLENELLLPLVHHRESAADQIARHKLGSLLSQATNYLQIALAAADQASAARKQLEQKINEERDYLEAFREELHVLTLDLSGRVMELSLGRLQPARLKLQEKVTAALQEQLSQWHLRLPSLLEAYRRWLHDLLSFELGRISCEQRPVFCEPLARVREHLTRALLAFQNRLSEQVKAALGISLASHEFNIEVREPEEPPIDVSAGFMVPMDVLGYAVPMFVFRPAIERSLLHRARYEVEKNLSRLASGWRDRVAVCIREIRCQAEKCAYDELAALENILTQTRLGHRD